MKPRNMRIYNVNQEVLVTLREEYIMLGFDTKLERGMLTVFTLPRKRKKKRKDEEKPERDKRREKFERRP